MYHSWHLMKLKCGHEILVYPLFFIFAWSYIFIKIFGKSKSRKKKMSINVFLTNVFWEFKGFHWRVISYPKNPHNKAKPLAKQIIQKFKRIFHMEKQSLSIQNVYFWNEERSSLICLHKVLNIHCSPYLSLIIISW